MWAIDRNYTMTKSIRHYFTAGKAAAFTGALVVLILASACDSPPHSTWHAEIDGEVAGYTFVGAFYSVDESGYKLDRTCRAI